MTTNDIIKETFTLLLVLVSFLVVGSFAVSLNIIHFIYLAVLYIYIYKIISLNKIVK